MRSLAGAVVLAVACRPTAAPTPVGDASLAPARLPAVDAAAPLCGHPIASLPVALHPADVLLLFDRSGSMVTEFGSGTRFSVEAGLLDQLVARYEARLRFGFQAFPSHDCAGASPGCCAGAPDVELADSDGDAIRAAIAGAAPVEGNTPTAAALRLAREYYARVDDGVPDRYVLLSTDGHPSCSATGRLEGDRFGANGARTSGPCHDALAEVDALVAAGIKLVVLGVGPDLDDDPNGGPSCLQEMAARGGAASPGRSAFYPAADPQQLERALQVIFGGVAPPTCLLALDEVPTDPSRVLVLVDGQPIPRSREHGWDWESPDDPTHLRLHGAYCERLERFQIQTVEVRYGCRSCPEGMICE